MLTVLILSHPAFTITFDPIASHISRTKDSPYVLVFHHLRLFPPPPCKGRFSGTKVASLDISLLLLFSFQVNSFLSAKLHSFFPLKKSPLYYSFIIMSMNAFIDVSPLMTNSAANLIGDAKASTMWSAKSFRLC